MAPTIKTAPCFGSPSAQPSGSSRPPDRTMSRSLRIVVAVVGALLLLTPAASSAAPRAGTITKAQAEVIARRQPAVQKVLARDPHALVAATAVSSGWEVAVMHDDHSAWDAAVYVGPSGHVDKA